MDLVVQEFTKLRKSWEVLSNGKEERAENFLALFENINRHNTNTVSNIDLEYREELKLNNHKLNQRGRYNYAEI